MRAIARDAPCARAARPSGARSARARWLPGNASAPPARHSANTARPHELEVGMFGPRSTHGDVTQLGKFQVFCPRYARDQAHTAGCLQQPRAEQQNGLLSHPQDLDAPLRIAAQRKVNDYRQQYAVNQNISFLPAIVSASTRMHGDCLRLLFLQAHWKTEAHFTATGMSSQRNQSDLFRFKRAAFYQSLKSKVGLASAKAAALRINLDVAGCGIVAAPVHAPSRAPLLLPLLLSHNLPLPRVH